MPCRSDKGTLESKSTVARGKGRKGNPQRELTLKSAYPDYPADFLHEFLCNLDLFSNFENFDGLDLTFASDLQLPLLPFPFPRL